MGGCQTQTHVSRYCSVCALPAWASYVEACRSWLVLVSKRVYALGRRILYDWMVGRELGARPGWCVCSGEGGGRRTWACTDGAAVGPHTDLGNQSVQAPHLVLDRRRLLLDFAALPCLDPGALAARRPEAGAPPLAMLGPPPTAGGAPGHDCCCLHTDDRLPMACPMPALTAVKANERERGKQVTRAACMHCRPGCRLQCANPWATKPSTCSLFAHQNLLCSNGE